MTEFNTDQDDKRLIEQGFPCHQVGAETQRERGASSALPPLYYLHVWWARRPLTPSRAAIVASLDPAGTDPEKFVRQLGIERLQVEINGEPWTLIGDLLKRMTMLDGAEVLEVDDLVLRRLGDEEKRRGKNRGLIRQMKEANPRLVNDPVLLRWERECQPVPAPLPKPGDRLEVQRVMGDPAWAKDRIAWETAHKIRTAEDKYAYARAYTQAPSYPPTGLTVLDPTAGGGSIPFEALRLGHKVIANELNPVATTILYATLDYPARFGSALLGDIEAWGKRLRDGMVDEMHRFFPADRIPATELELLKANFSRCPSLVDEYLEEHLDGFIYVRQVTCPHCNGEAPLLNTHWLSKAETDRWGVRVVTYGHDAQGRNGKVRFETFRLAGTTGPNGEDPDAATVTRGVGQCVHCKQAIDGDEIKRQARGESEHGKWTDRLYTVVAVRFEPKLDKDGKPQRYKSGARKGEIKTQKVRFFRPPNERDLDALVEAELRLEQKRPAWEEQGLVPTEGIPYGHRRDERDGIVKYGITHWTDMFTPRQLLGHLYLIEGLNRLKPQIIEELGEERGRAVVTYLQFAIDKGVDYNSKQTRWHFSRGVLVGTFGRHDFSLKWTFGEMIFTGPQSGATWGLSQVLDAYRGIAELASQQPQSEGRVDAPSLQILSGTAAHLPSVSSRSVDLVCMDPPYYNNVQYGELSDFYYVWQRRTLKDLYPELYSRRLVTKSDEAVANPARDGGKERASQAYEHMMGEIFSECRRVLKEDGILTLMFTHKEQEAWEALTKSLIESGWDIKSSFPVESEGSHSIHVANLAAAESSIFIACRKRSIESSIPASWTGLGGQGVQHQIRDAVRDGLVEFAPLKLNPVDEMVASYGRALHVLSQNWPVMDGDEEVSPIRAMNEASRVVAEQQIQRITNGRLKVDDLDPESAMALTLYGIFGLYEITYDEALNLSRSLNIALSGKSGGYRVEDGRFIGINQEQGARSSKPQSGNAYHAPLVRKGSKLRLARPEERSPARLERPLADWDVLHGLLMAYRRGDEPVARQYLATHAGGRESRILDLLEVWATESDEDTLRQEAETLKFGLQAGGFARAV